MVYSRLPTDLNVVNLGKVFYKDIDVDTMRQKLYNTNLH